MNPIWVFLFSGALYYLSFPRIFPVSCIWIMDSRRLRYFFAYLPVCFLLKGFSPLSYLICAGFNGKKKNELRMRTHTHWGISRICPSHILAHTWTIKKHQLCGRSLRSSSLPQGVYRL